MKDEMTGAYDYSIDKESGDKGEGVIIKFLENHEGLTFVRKSSPQDGDDPADFDLLFRTPEGNDVTFEVKTDLYCKPGKDTGNIAIEHRRKQYDNEDSIVPTGIRKTKSNFYIYYYWNLNELWMIPTCELFNLLNEMKDQGQLEPPGGKRHKWMGDQKRSLSYLIPRKQYRNKFHVFTFKRESL